jgi:hypothetical protein
VPLIAIDFGFAGGNAREHPLPCGHSPTAPRQLIHVIPRGARFFGARSKPGDSEALDVLAHILGHGSNSRLYQELVVDRDVAVNAGDDRGQTASVTRLCQVAVPGRRSG